MKRARTTSSTSCSTNKRRISWNPGSLAPPTTSTRWNGIPALSARHLQVSRLPMIEVISTGSSPSCVRHSTSLRQWSVLVTITAVRMRYGAS